MTLEDRNIFRWIRYEDSPDWANAGGTFGGTGEGDQERGSKIVLDLEEVDLVDVQIVRFLGACEAQGITLLNCSPYIRDWIGKERD